MILKEIKNLPLPGGLELQQIIKLMHTLYIIVHLSSLAWEYENW
jgi:hypothetical protein